MVASVPKFIDPFLLADKNASIEGKLSLSDFDRISDLLSHNSGQVTFSLRFAKKGRLVKIEGDVVAELSLKCQRCLDPLIWPINANIKLGIVNSLEQIDRLPQGFEPLLLTSDEKIATQVIIEDELLLNLPSVPKHDNNCLVVNFSGCSGGLMIENTHSAPKNPFSILADLKKLEISNGSTKK